MKRTLNQLLFIPFVFIAIFSNAIPDHKQVDIVISATATKQELKAAEQLRSYLGELYPDFLFTVNTHENKNSYIVNINLSKKEFISNEEGFQIRKVSDKQVNIEAGSSKGLFNAVYSLMEKLGYGFYLSFDTKPLSKKELNFTEWELNDFPLCTERIIFNWHNFLSGCTGWNYEDWCSWIDQSAKMRYNTIMVHAYGNNPMFSFEYNGLKKAVGYLNTSQSGRDWGAQHVNDVRRLPGGDVFSGPVLGSLAALVPEEQRSEAATKLMSRVFEHAFNMNMKINFAIDLDTWSSNPKNIIESLPSTSRIKLKEQDIVNPETPEGYKYYKAQIQSLLSSYPHLSAITLFIRNGRSLWNDMTPDQLPYSWSGEWKQLIQKHPELEHYNHAPSLFTVAKVMIAFQKALKELNHKDVTLTFGSFNLETVPYADLILSPECPIIFLEQMPNFDSEERKKVLSKQGQNRKITIIFYGHHDDHRYMGRPYAPFKNFNQMLRERNLAGFGLLHWTTRPLDLLFRNMNDQVWNRTVNKSLDSTISDYCRTTFGETQEPLINYLNQWITNGPMFGRETMDHFFDLGKQMFGEKHEPFEITIGKIRDRKNLLKQVDYAKLSKSGKKRFDYDASMEEFYLAVFQNQELFNKAYDMLGRGSMDSAREVLEKVSPEKAIDLYAKTSSILPITQGEKALIVSMGTRWIPDFINLKQRAGMLDICYKFQATSHDTLAQQPGINTYFIDQEKRWWSCLGEKEIKAGLTGSFSRKETDQIPENSLTYLKITKPLSLPIVTIGRNNLAAGTYTVELKFKSSAVKPQLNQISKNSRIPLKTVYDGSDHGLSSVSAVIEIRDNQNIYLEINPAEKEKLLTNLLIRPVRNL